MNLVLALLLAADRPVIDLSGGRVQAVPVAVASSGEAAAVLSQDLERSGLFKLLDPKSFLDTGAQPDYAKWRDVGAAVLVKLVCAEKCEGQLFDVTRGEQSLHGAYEGPARQVAHRFGDDIVRYFTHEPGIFQTRIAYVRDTGEGKQVIVADWDGANAQALTGSGLNLLPAWLPSGEEIAFTGFRDGGAAHIFTIGVTSRAVKPLVLAGDFATGAAFAPDGAHFLYAASIDDNTDLFVSSADAKSGKRVTDARGIDISGSWSPDGKRIAFVSERAGSPQIFTMAADGTDVRRVTFQGNYNQEPAWSPKGDLIAFSGRDEHRVFDLYTVAVEGGKVTRLTQNQGTNEKPTWSPNGRYLMFSSSRSGKKQLWLTLPDGSAQHQVTTEKHGATDPAWGPLP